MAAPSDVSVCNRALSLIGNTKRISSLTAPGDEAAYWCNEWFDTCRRETLESAPWPFAHKRHTPAPLAGVTRDAWDYVFALPADCVAVDEVLPPGVRNPSRKERIPFKVESNDAGDGLVMLCDVAEVEVIYTLDHAHIPAWSAVFTRALEWLLASKLALSIKKDPNLAAAMEEMHNRQLLRAGEFNSSQRQDDMPPLTPSLAARR